MYSLLSSLVWLLLGSICSKIARKKGRNPTLWFVLGIFLGIIAFIILYLLPYKKLEGTIPSRSNKTDNDLSESSDTPKKINILPESTILWYYLDNENKQYGPMSFFALKKNWNDNKIISSTYVWNENMDNWQTLEKLPTLFEKICATSEPSTEP